MSDNCPGCFESLQGQEVQFQKVKNQAIEDSKKHKKPMAIFKEGTEYRCLDAFHAYATGFGPVIREVVSAYHGPAIEELH